MKHKSLQGVKLEACPVNPQTRKFNQKLARNAMNDYLGYKSYKTEFGW